MNIAAIAEMFPDYARDIKLNLATVLTEEGAPDLTQSQIWGVALACAFATRNLEIADAILGDAKDKVTGEYIEAARSAAAIMAMNNVYYRFLHLVEDQNYRELPAKLRMNVL